MRKSVIIPLFLAAIAGLAAGIFISAYKSVNIPREASVGESADFVAWPESADFVARPEAAAASDTFKVPEGFRMSVFADGVSGARVLALDPRGVFLVSRPEAGEVSALPDEDGDGKADRIVSAATGLNEPHGMAFDCPLASPPMPCKLYVAETDALSVFDYDAETMQASNQRKLLPLPGGGGHSTRTLLFLPPPHGNTLLISIGSSCNVCNESDARRASIIAYDTKTGKSEPFAKGLRNSVFMELNPVNGAVWATEMGRDLLGDEIPPDEINVIAKGKNYGWPICYGKNVHDDAFDKNTYIRNPCMEPFEMQSHIDIPAHSAPLGLAFIPEEGWPEDHWYNLLVAYHGSWNRSSPTGYKVVRVKLDAAGNYLGTEDFLTGWLLGDGAKIGRPAGCGGTCGRPAGCGGTCGRPVDIKVFPGQTVYISDDGAGRVYRLTRA